MSALDSEARVAPHVELVRFGGVNGHVLAIAANTAFQSYASLDCKPQLVALIAKIDAAKGKRHSPSQLTCDISVTPPTYSGMPLNCLRIATLAGLAFTHLDSRVREGKS